MRDRRRAYLVSAVSLVLVFLSVAAPALRAAADEHITAGEVASWCEPYRTAVLKDHNVAVQVTADSQVCWGAFIAIQQFAATEFPGDRNGALHQCLPPASDLVELIKVFLHYSDTHPEMGHWKFTDVVLKALWAAYPCSGKRAPAK